MSNKEQRIGEIREEMARLKKLSANLDNQQQSIKILKS